MKSLLSLTALVFVLFSGLSQKAQASCNPSTGCFFTVVYDRNWYIDYDLEYDDDPTDDVFNVVSNFEGPNEIYAASSGESQSKGNASLSEGRNAFVRGEYSRAASLATAAYGQFGLAKAAANASGDAAGAAAAQAGMNSATGLYNSAMSMMGGGG